MAVFIANGFDDSNLGGAALTIASTRLLKRAFPNDAVELLSVDEVGSRAHERFAFTLQAHPGLSVGEPLILGPKSGPLAGLRTVIESMRALKSKGEHPAVQRLAGASAVVGKAGHIYFQKGNGSLAGLASLWMTTYPLRLAAALGIPTAALNTSIGPFPSPLFRRVAASVLKQLDLVVPREPSAREEALRLGVRPERIVEVPDIVFSFDRPTEEAALAAAASAGLVHGRFGVITISKHGGMSDAFLDRLSETLSALLKGGVIDAVVAPIHASEDRALTEAFIRRASDPRIRILPMDGWSPERLMALYRSARFLISRRMHSAIFSLIAGTPAYPFTMEDNKVERVMGSLGLSSFVQQSPLRDASLLVERISADVEDPSVPDRILRAVASAREEVLRLPEILKACLVRSAERGTSSPLGPPRSLSHRR
jgi:polysaccharide pyruvyl transferase WcaK-like protein